MNILIVDFDFFSTAGGGQTYYQTLVKRNPGADFHFFTKADASASEEMRWKLPSNVHPIAYREDRRSWFIVKQLCKQFPCIAKELIYTYGTEAVNIAYSISGRSFDVADIPSFRPIHPVLPALFELNNVRCGKVVLSIHGWMHKAMDLCWERPEELVQSLRLIDQACLETSDIRYEISKFNLLNTKQLTSMPLSYFDIHNVLETGSSLPAMNSTADQLPDIWFPARLDRQKGVDLFLEIIARVPRHLYGSIRLCGPDGNERGRTWLSRVHDLARSLGLEIVYHGTLLREQVFAQVFTKPNYCVFPSRYDSFGLAEIEALSAGCPSAISNQCGVSHFLAESYPDIPFTTMDINKLGEASQKIADDLMGYKELRNNLLQSIVQNPFKPWVQDAVLSIYRMPEIPNQVQRTAINKSVSLAIRNAKIYEILYTIKLRLRSWISSVCPLRLKLIILHVLNKFGFLD